MKKVFFTLIISSLSVGAFAQSTATSVTYNKAVQPAVLTRLPYNQDVSEDFVAQALSKSGNTQSRKDIFNKDNVVDGYHVLHNVSLSGLQYPVDLYIKTDESGRRSSRETMVYIMASKGGDQMASAEQDPDTYNAERQLLDGFTTITAAYDLNQKIADQQKTLEAAEKKLDKIRDDEKDLNKKLENNHKDQNDQQSTIDKEKKKLDDMKSQAGKTQ